MAETGPLDELLAHLTQLQDRPNQENLNTSLVERSRLHLHQLNLQPRHVLQLAHLTFTLLRTSQDDLEPLLYLLSEAIDLVTFDDLRASIPVDVVVEGLSSHSPSVQLLGLSYLTKATESPSGAAAVANDDALVKALIKLFLTSKSADIGGTKALAVLLSLLSVDNPEQITTIIQDGSTGQTVGQGLLWRRIFEDEQIYSLFFQFTSAQGSAHGLSTLEITTAQARLLDFIIRAAGIRWDILCESSGVQTSPSSQGVIDVHRKSLLQYGALTMVDQSDPLMTNILVDFLTKLLELKNPYGCSRIASIPATSSPPLEFLVSSGLHQKALDYYLRSEEFDAFEIQFLGGAHTRYLCTYMDLYPEHFVQSADLARDTIKRLNRNLQISGARWAHGSSPVQDLNVLAHMPAISLAMASRSEQNPLMLLPTNPANGDVLQTLGKIFHGPGDDQDNPDEGLSAESNPFGRGSRAAAARTLFYQYHDRHPEFWSNIGAAMNVLAMPQAISAAIGLVRSILTATWARLPETGPDNSGDPLSLPTEQGLRELCGGNVLETGVGEVLNAGETVIESLLTPLKTMGGDAEAARLAWRLGRDKFDLVVLISDLMKKGVGQAEVPAQLWQNVGQRIQERIRLDAGGGFVTQTNLVGTMGR